MNVKAKIGAWSSVVGGGVLLIGEDGRMVGQIAFLCHDDRLRERGMQEKLAQICCDAINTRTTPDPISDPRVRAIVELLREANNDLKAYVDADWPERMRRQYPDMQRRWKRDMELCRRIDAAMRAIEEGGE
mgnify:CR=1 FL=1